jgi:hypothetical protein
MAKHDIDPVLQQLAQAINESGQGAVPARGTVLPGALIAEQDADKPAAAKAASVSASVTAAPPAAPAGRGQQQHLREPGGRAHLGG